MGVLSRGVSGSTVGFIVGAMSLLLAACGSSSAAVSASKSVSTNKVSSAPYVFHADLSETGQLAFLGSRQAKALTGLVANVNLTGGIDGHKIVLDIKDNQSNPSTSVSIATQWIAQKVPFIFNGSTSATDRAVDALDTPNGPVIYDLSPVDSSPPNSEIFVSGVSYQLDIQAVLNFIKSKGLTKIALLNSSDATGVSSWPILQSLLKLPEYTSLQLVGHQTFEPTATSVATQMAVIKASNPQALLIWTTGTPFGTALQAQSQLGLSNLPTFTSAGNAVYGEMKNLSNVLPKQMYFPTGALYLSPSTVPSNLRSTVSTFQSVVAKAGGHPNDGWGLAYVPAQMLISALKQLGVGATPSQVDNYFQQLNNYPTIYGVFNLSNTDHSGVTINGVYMTSWNGTGFIGASGPGGVSK